MIARELLDVIAASGVEFATGVPDSLLSDVCAALESHASIRHLVAANEGAAIALAAGHYLATNKRALVYMQNSGLPNAVNPYVSMCHPSVYDMPSIWVIGWRGQPGTTDEPQHMAMGASTLAMLELMGIPVFRMAHGQPDAATRLGAWLKEQERKTVAIVVPTDALDRSPGTYHTRSGPPLRRCDVLDLLVQGCGSRDDVVFAGIGHVGRELLAARAGASSQQEFAGDFLCVGGMGHASQFALGFALSQPRHRVWCLDGDGAFTMHMGSCNWISRHPRLRFVHVLFDNGVHASVGGQAVCGKGTNYGAIARAVGYPEVLKVSTPSEAEAAISVARLREEPTFLWCRVDAATPPSLPRPHMRLVDRCDFFRKNHHD